MKKIILSFFLILLSFNLFSTELLLSGATKTGKDSTIYMLVREDNGDYSCVVSSINDNTDGAVTLKVTSSSFKNVFILYYRYYLTQDLTFSKTSLENVAKDMKSTKTLLDDDPNQILYTITIKDK